MNALPGAWAAALAVILAATTAQAEPCPAGSGCVSDAAVRQADADQAELPELRLQIRVAEQRLVVALDDAAILSGAVDGQSHLVLDLRAEVASERARWPAVWWWLLGGACGVAASIVLALSL